MKLLKHHFKKSDSWMWMYWVRHNGFGLRPRLKVNWTDRGGMYFYFLFTWWKFEWYCAKSKRIKRNYGRTTTETTDAVGL